MEFKIIKTEKGYNQIDFGNYRNNQGFYQFAKRLQDILQIKYVSKKDNFNTLFWDYQYHNVVFILYYDWHHGTTIYLRNKEKSTPYETEVFDDLVKTLKQYQ